MLTWLRNLLSRPATRRELDSLLARMAEIEAEWRSTLDAMNRIMRRIEARDRRAEQAAARKIQKAQQEQTPANGKMDLAALRRGFAQAKMGGAVGPLGPFVPDPQQIQMFDEDDETEEAP